MKGHFTMSNKEANRVSMMEKLVKKEVKQVRATQILGLSTRQVRRLKRRYQQRGPAGLVHQSRGKPSHNRINQKEIDRAVEIIRTKYFDFGPTLAYEKLIENHKITFSVETLRKAVINAGLWQPKRRRKPRIHQMRERRSCEGELVQMDGSPHAWFEDRGPECTLLGYIDDATGKVKWLQFFVSETTQAYFKATREYLKRYGKPLAFYSDKNSIFRINMTKGGTASVNDSQGLTQFGRAMKELGIELIPANTPQAKGRIERLYQTLQDRLVKELRLKGIFTIKQGNQYLPEFMVKFNLRFAVKPRDPVNVHRPLLLQDDLRKIFVFQYTRILSNNLTCQLENKLYQIKTKRPTYAMRHAPVLVRKDLEGKISIEYKGRKLNYTILKRQPKANVVNNKQINQVVERIKEERQIKQTPWIPPADHPWRYLTVQQ